jgi:hypothetical protein
MICAVLPHPNAPSQPWERLVVSEQEIVSEAQEDQTEGQPIASDQALATVQTPHLRNLLFSRDLRARGREERSRSRDNHRGSSDCSTNVLSTGRSDFLEVGRDGSQDGSGSRSDRSNHSAQRSDDHAIDLSGEDGGGEFDCLDIHALQLDGRSGIGGGGGRIEGGQSSDVDRGGHSVEDCLGDGSSGGR